MKKLRVGVIMGGKSIEREVSFNSGRTVCDHLDTSRYEIIPIFQTKEGNLFILPWHFLHRGKITDFYHRLSGEAKQICWDDLKKLIDFMYIAMHGRYAEDGTLQGFLEVLGIPYLGSDVFSSALGMDKIMQKEILRLHGLDVPNGIVVTPEQIINFENHKDQVLEMLNKQNLSFPLVVKPYKEGSSLGITVVFEQKDLLPALKTACFVHTGEQQAVVVEEKIEGMEFSCITITDHTTNRLVPLPPTEVVVDPNIHLFDYEQKYMPGRATEFTPPRCDKKTIKQIQDACISVTKALGFTTISRIDGFVTKDNKIIIVDPNSLSGMGPASFLFREAAHADMSHPQLINHLIETELQNYGLLSKIHQDTQGEEQINMKTKTKKIRVAVLMGGNTNEREISLESGRNVVYKLSPHKYEAMPVFVTDSMELFVINQKLLVLKSTKEIQDLVNVEMKIKWSDLPKKADFVFIGLHGGAGENGAVQGTLEMLGLPYNGSSVLASALCMDKFKTTQFLKAKGFDVPKAVLLEKKQWKQNSAKQIEVIITKLQLPLIVKPHDDGCSIMVQKVKTKKELQQAIETVFAQNKTVVLIEECVTGMELTVGVIGNQKPIALPPSQAVCASEILSIQEKFLPGQGENQTPALLPKATLMFVKKTVEQVYKAIGCTGYSRIDCFYQNKQQSPTGKPRVVIIEINTLPGMTPATCIFHQAAEIGIKPMEFIDRIITLGFEKHQSFTNTSKIKEQKNEKIIR